MKRGKKILIAAVWVAVLIAAAIIGVKMYKKSPIYIIKNTVMKYEKDFTIPVFSKKIKFEYDKNTGEYAGKFQISEAAAKKVKRKIEKAYGCSVHADAVITDSKLGKGDIIYEDIINTTEIEDCERDEEKWESTAGREWLTEDGKIIFWYRTNTRYYIAETGGLLNNDCFIFNDVVLYRNVKGEYFLCVQRRDDTERYID